MCHKEAMISLTGAKNSILRDMQQTLYKINEQIQIDIPPLSPSLVQQFFGLVQKFNLLNNIWNEFVIDLTYLTNTKNTSQDILKWKKLNWSRMLFIF